MSIKIIGCGKCGNNIVDYLQQLNLPRVEYYSMNLSSKNEKEYQIENTFSLNEMQKNYRVPFLKGILFDAKPCFILAGLGGKTGSQLVIEDITEKTYKFKGLIGSFAAIHQKFYEIISAKIVPIKYPFP